MRGLRKAIQQGRLASGLALPASRTLARELAVSRGVVVEAYAELTADGYLEARQGSGTRVRPIQSVESADPAAEREHGVSIQLLSGRPDPASFPRQTWLRHYRAVLASEPDALFGYPEPQGAVALRRALAGYVGRVRGVSTNSEQMLICGGFVQGLALVCRVLRDRGVTQVAVEDPCFSFHRRVIRAAGLEPLPVPQDEEGLDVSRVSRLSVGAVLLAPAHSYPTGAVLSPRRRIELLDWARAADALVIEDDYDAEFRYDRSPIGAMQGLAPEHVLYGASTSKVLSPALRIGWLAAPAWLIGDLLRAKFLDDIAAEGLGQLTLARFIESGDFARHLRRVRPIYRDRRDALVQALAEFIPELEPQGVAAGLHLYVPLPPHLPEDNVIEIARRSGVQLEGAARHWANRDASSPALILGYGTLHATTAKRAVATLAAALPPQL